MKFWESVTGSDLTRQWKAFEARAAGLPADYRQAWEQIRAGITPRSDFTGRNLIPIADGVLGLLEESAADGLSIEDVLGDDIAGFCAALTGGEGARTYRDRWREQLNRDVAKKLSRLGG
jgi:DNA-binding ferritin-like protein (Dps family)